MSPKILVLIALAAFAGGCGVLVLAHSAVPGGVGIAAAEAPLTEALRVAPDYAATTSPQAPAVASDSRVPILVYHIVRPSYADDSAAVRAIAVTPAIFDAQMTHLASAGYHVVPFSALEAHLASLDSTSSPQATPLPAKPVVITLDDGWQDQYDYAFPILKAHGYPATFFVFTNAIGSKGFFTWEELKELLAAGMTIGDHTKSHPYLTRLSAATQQAEIAGSKAILERELGVPIKEFAYPFGLFDATTTALVRQAGFVAARDDGGSSLQSEANIYHLGSMNAPTTTAAFDKRFP